MFEWTIFILINAFWFTFMFQIPVLFGYRIYFAYKSSLEIKKKLLLILIPFSIGFFLYYPHQSKHTQTYRKLIVFFFVTGFLSSLLLLYMHFELNLI